MCSDLAIQAIPRLKGRSFRLGCWKRRANPSSCGCERLGSRAAASTSTRHHVDAPAFLRTLLVSPTSRQHHLQPTADSYLCPAPEKYSGFGSGLREVPRGTRSGVGRLFQSRAPLSSSIQQLAQPERLYALAWPGTRERPRAHDRVPFRINAHHLGPPLPSRSKILLHECRFSDLGLLTAPPPRRPPPPRSC